MVRRFATAFAVIVGVSLLAPVRGPSIEDMFVATTQAAAQTEGMNCLMPEGVDGPPKGRPHDRPSYVASGFSRTGEQIAIPKSSNVEGGDLPPVRMVVDPYPTFNGGVVDTTNDLLMMSDTNRGGLLVYDRTAGSLTSKEAAAP